MPQQRMPRHLALALAAMFGVGGTGNRKRTDRELRNPNEPAQAARIQAAADKRARRLARNRAIHPNWR